MDEEILARWRNGETLKRIAKSLSIRRSEARAMRLRALVREYGVTGAWLDGNAMPQLWLDGERRKRRARKYGR